MAHGMRIRTLDDGGRGVTNFCRHVLHDEFEIRNLLDERTQVAIDEDSLPADSSRESDDFLHVSATLLCHVPVKDVDVGVRDL